MNFKLTKTKSNNITFIFTPLILIYFVFFSCYSLHSQPNDALAYIVGKIKNEQRRIDLFDSIIDNRVHFGSQLLNDKIQQSLFFKINDLILLIEKREINYKTK